MKAKILFFSAITVCIAVFVSCSFHPELDKPSPVPLSPPLALERHEELALLHLEETHEVTPEVLQGQVNNFLAGNAAARGAGSPASAITGVRKFSTVLEDGFATTTSNSRSTDIVAEASEIPFYLFDIANPVEQTSGYALTCGDIRLPGVIAVVEDGEFEDGDHPFLDIFYSNLAGYILETVEIYNSVTDEDIATAAEKQKELIGEYRAFNDPKVLATLKPHDDPLVTKKTKWDQAVPYWDVINSIRGVPLSESSGKKVYTGCVATALAQIMAYHGKPAKPASTIDGKTSFLDPYTKTTKTFANITYHWPQIKEKPFAKDLSDQYKMEIGVLMHEVGKNIKTKYGTNGSGATESDVVTGITKMGYKKPSVHGYSLSKIQASIDEKKPVYIGGFEYKVTSYSPIDIFKWFPQTSYKGGHAWVIDNYQTHFYSSTKKDEYVHCNLGWSDWYNYKNIDGWYLSGVFDVKKGPVARSIAGTEDLFKYDLVIIPNITPNS